MKLVLFGSRSDSPRGARVGVLLDDTTVADVTQAAANAGHVALSSMRAFLDAGDEGGKWAAAAVADPTLHLKLNTERVLLAPIYDPEKVLCVGMNYVDHCTEQGVPIPVEPIIFNKFASAIRASGDSLIKSPETAELDFEVELTVVIGKTGKRISKEDALGYVAGYTVAHDVSARDLQLRKNGGQWLLGKAMDGFAPLGPAIVTPDEVGDVHNLRLRTIVNGAVMQDSSTSQLVHKVPDLIAYISRFMTLRPGDLILTGTPPGVGCFRKPPVWLKAGDVVTVEIEKLGAVTNTVVDEEA